MNTQEDPRQEDPKQQDPRQEDPRVEQSEDIERPENPGINGKADLPDPDLTDPSTLPSMADEIDDPVADTRFGGEHAISPDHAEPTDVTKTTNDNYIEGKYIDVGGGD